MAEVLRLSVELTKSMMFMKVGIHRPATGSERKVLVSTMNSHVSKAVDHVSMAVDHVNTAVEPCDNIY